MLFVNGIEALGAVPVSGLGERFGKTTVRTALRGKRSRMTMLALVPTVGMKTGLPGFRIVISISVLRLHFGMAEILF